MDNPFVYFCIVAWGNSIERLIVCWVILQALSELHDQIPPFPRSIAMKIIEEELGSPVESFFSFISEEPVAAASFGQVFFLL